jgi:hypothetical protein
VYSYNVARGDRVESWIGRDAGESTWGWNLQNVGITVFIIQFNTMNLLVAHRVYLYIIYIILRINNDYFPKDNNWYLFIMEKMCVSANWAFCKIKTYSFICRNTGQKSAHMRKILRLTVLTQVFLVFAFVFQQMLRLFQSFQSLVHASHAALSIWFHLITSPFVKCNCVSKLHITLLTMELKLLDTCFTILFAVSYYT